MYKSRDNYFNKIEKKINFDLITCFGSNKKKFFQILSNILSHNKKTGERKSFFLINTVSFSIKILHLILVDRQLSE